MQQYYKKSDLEINYSCMIFCYFLLCYFRWGSSSPKSSEGDESISGERSPHTWSIGSRYWQSGIEWWGDWWNKQHTEYLQPNAETSRFSAQKKRARLQGFGWSSQGQLKPLLQKNRQRSLDKTRQHNKHAVKIKDMNTKVKKQWQYVELKDIKLP